MRSLSDVITAFQRRMKARKKSVLYDSRGRKIGMFGHTSIERNVSRAGASRKGAMSNWIVHRLSRHQEEYERDRLVDRSLDLVGSDPHAGGLITSMNANVVGTGLVPQSEPKADVLGFDEEQTRTFQTAAEWNYQVWGPHADAAGRLHIQDIQFLLERCLLTRGEFVLLPLMIKRAASPFSLALQVIDPVRLRTPSDKRSSRGKVREGVELGAYGQPVAYWIKKYDPNKGEICNDNSTNFVRIPRFRGHRPQVLHGFYQENPGQTRGYPILSPAISFFKNLTDFLDAELLANVVTAAFALFIETGADADPFGIAGDRATYTEQGLTASGGSRDIRYEEIPLGGIMYGNSGEKPTAITSERPGRTFDVFVMRVLRAIGASVGMPYEVIAKDFSKTNYSSARAALLEAWRIFRHRQAWLSRHFCQPVWDMLQEEAYLRDKLPITNDDYYEQRQAYNRARWIPPARGWVDPVKEVDADIKAIQHLLKTRTDVVAEQGGDWDDKVEAAARELAKIRKLGLKDEALTPSKEYPSDEEEEEEQT